MTSTSDPSSQRRASGRQLTEWSGSALEAAGVSVSLAEGQDGTRVLLCASGPDGAVVAAFAVPLAEARRLAEQTLPDVLALAEGEVGASAETERRR